MSPMVAAAPPITVASKSFHSKRSSSSFLTTPATIDRPKPTDRDATCVASAMQATR